MRKRKWWWSIMMWCLKMIHTNAYVLYRKYMTIHNLKEITHFEFNREICLDWTDSENYCPKKKGAYQHQALSCDITSSTTRSTNTVSEDFIKRSPRFTDKYLWPLSDNLRVHLQESDTHWLVPNLKKTQVVNYIVGKWAQTRICEVVWQLFCVVKQHYVLHVLFLFILFLVYLTLK